jgi:hypothetical protein
LEQTFSGFPDENVAQYSKWQVGNLGVAIWRERKKKDHGERLGLFIVTM